MDSRALIRLPPDFSIRRWLEGTPGPIRCQQHNRTEDETTPTQQKSRKGGGSCGLTASMSGSRVRSHDVVAAFHLRMKLRRTAVALAEAVRRIVVRSFR